uniref:Uncharacterized protein n=1 Tax=Myotis myotis TaxID=51298 RepID=A0A7J7UQ62_MYOMY|nr:hypothetical protein mMyoMyo1_008666 [Myotis myotis]
MFRLEAQCMNLCTSGVPRPGLQDWAKTSSLTSLEGSWIARGHRPGQGTSPVHNRGQGETREVGQLGRNCGGLQGMSSPSHSVPICQTPAASSSTGQSVCPLVVCVHHSDWSTSQLSAPWWSLHVIASG